MGLVSHQHNYMQLSVMNQCSWSQAAAPVTAKLIIYMWERRRKCSNPVLYSNSDGFMFDTSELFAQHPGWIAYYTGKFSQHH